VIGRSILVLAAGLLMTNIALAEGFYAGGGLGIVQIEDSDQGISFKDSPFGFRLIAGFDINDNFAIEGGYIATDTAEDTIEGIDVEAELSAFTLSFLGLIPVGDSASLFGKVGYYSGEQEVTVFGITVDEDDDGFMAGAGIRFDMANNWTIRGDFDWFDTDLDTLWSIGVGVQYLFGK
jgi:OOP family OmpA-OmpF porin